MTALALIQAATTRPRHHAHPTPHPNAPRLYATATSRIIVGSALPARPANQRNLRRHPVGITAPLPDSAAAQDGPRSLITTHAYRKASAP